MRENGGELKATVSIGASQLKPKTELERAFKQADEVLYKAKEGGRNGTVING